MLFLHIHIVNIDFIKLQKFYLFHHFIQKRDFSTTIAHRSPILLSKTTSNINSFIQYTFLFSSCKQLEMLTKIIQN